jgi:hypothetical protein
MPSVARPAAAGCFLLKTNGKQIPRFARDDMVGVFFISLLG